MVGGWGGDTKRRTLEVLYIKCKSLPLCPSERHCSYAILFVIEYCGLEIQLWQVMHGQK